MIGFAGGNETLWDNGVTTTGHDSVSTFSQAGGDRVSLNSATDTIANVLGTASTSGGNTTVTLHVGSTITFIGISSVNNTFFTTHSHVRRFQMQANESVACMQALVSGSSGQGRRQGRRNDG